MTKTASNGNITKQAKSIIPSAGYAATSTGQDSQDSQAMMQKLLHWAAVIESSDDAIISKSIDGYITGWNAAAQRLYGYTAEEVIGKPVSILMPPERIDDFPMIMNQLKAGKKIDHYETRRKTKTGRIIDVSITVSPIKDAKGNLIGASKIARNIADRKQDERRRDEFVSTVSHELKTPIASQKIYGELLQQQIDKDGLGQYQTLIKKMNQQTIKLEKLVNDLLELSQLHMGRIKLEPQEFELSQLVSDIIEPIQSTSTHKIVNQTKKPTLITADRDRIGQVIANLVSNAVKYSPHPAKIIIATKAEPGQVVVSIQDFGIGIDPEYSQRIFERFFRINGEDETTYPGMGIGLNVSAKIISLHQGKIWVESQAGQGSTFYFSLPSSRKTRSEGQGR